MRKASLLYNPMSGSRHGQRQAKLDAVLAILRDAGVEARLVLTRSRLDAAEQARQAVAAGCDTIFACGGDGTVHDILQGMAGSQTALALLPMGTANALAHDLGVPLNPVAAAKIALRATPRRIALGSIQHQDFEGKASTRFFTVAVGIGVDAHLFYKLNPAIKERLGMAAYYAKAWHLWLTHRMIRFQVEYDETGADAAKQASVTELLAVRIRNFGGVLRELAPAASLQRNDLRLVLCHTNRRTAYLLYVLRGLLGKKWNVPGVELVHSGKVRCQYLPRALASDQSKPQTNVYIEADGELVGTLPAEISVVPDALTLLAPSPQSAG